MHTGVSKETNEPGREARKRNVMESKPADILNTEKFWWMNMTGNFCGSLD